MRRIPLILCFTFLGIPAFSAPRSHPKTMSGRIVVYSIPLACLNGNADWSMVIHVEQPSNLHGQFIRVDFSLPCDKSPQWVSGKSTVQEFHLLRRKDCDGVLEEFMKEEQHGFPVVPLWKYLDGAEHAAIPFGQIVSCYRSIDLPLLPAV